MTATRNGQRSGGLRDLLFRRSDGPGVPGDVYPRDPYPRLDVNEVTAPRQPPPDPNRDDTGTVPPARRPILPPWMKSQDGIRRNVTHAAPILANQALAWGFDDGYFYRPAGWVFRGLYRLIVMAVEFAVDAETLRMQRDAARRGDGRARAYERKERFKTRRTRLGGTAGIACGVAVLGAALTSPEVALWLRVPLALVVLAGCAVVGAPRSGTEDPGPARSRSETEDPATTLVRSDRVVAVFDAAGLKGVMTVGGTHRRDRGPAGWEAVVDLKSGTTFAEVQKNHDALCSGWRVPRERLYLRRGAHEGQVHMTLFDQDPATADPIRTPLRDLEVENPFAPVPIGTTMHGDPYGLVLPGTSGTWICSAPGNGKTNLLLLLIAWAALHPRVLLFIHDGKGEGDLDAYADLCEHYSTGASNAAGEECARMLGVVEDLREARRETMRRLRAERPDVLPTSQITPEAVGDSAFGLPLVLAVVDEFNEMVGTNAGSVIQDRARGLAQIGRSGGIMPVIAGQRFDSKVLDGAQSSMGTRIAFRTNSPEDSNMVLGGGQVGEGFNTARWPDHYQGVCIVRPGGVQVHRGTQQIKTHLGELEDHRAIAARAARARRAGGAELGKATGRQDLLARVLDAMGAENVVPVGELADGLGLDAEALVADLRKARVPVEPSRKHSNRRAVRRQDVVERLM